MFYSPHVPVVALVAALALPAAGVLVPGKSLGGVRLGATEAQVRAAWGPRVGVCRGCPERTLYFTYKRFAPQGAGATFRKGRAVALFTLWWPPGWRTKDGVHLGASVGEVADRYGILPRTDCDGYYALTLPRRRSVTAFYFVGTRLWAFGLLRPGVSICR